MAVEIKTNIYFVVVKDSLIDEMDGNQKDLLERKIESDLTKVDTLKRNDEDYRLYLSNGEVPAEFIFSSDLLLEAELIYCSGFVTNAAIKGEVKAIRSRWFPSGISPLEYLEDGRFEKFRDDTTVKFIQDISSSISAHSHQLTRPVLEHCIRVINKDLSSGKLS